MQIFTSRSFRIGPFAVAALLVPLLLLVFHGSATSQERADTLVRLPAEQASAVDALGQYADQSDLLVRLMIRRTGFDESLGGVGYDRYPIVRKIESAVFSAEAAIPGSGPKVLAALAHQIQDRYGGDARPPALKPFAELPKPNAGSLKFTKLPAGTPNVLPAEMSRAIEQLSTYCEGPGSGAIRIMTRDLGLTPDRAYDILRTSGTTAEALKRGMAYVPEQERNPRLASAIRAVADRYESAAHVAEFRPYLGLGHAASGPQQERAPIIHLNPADGTAGWDSYRRNPNDPNSPPADFRSRNTTPPSNRGGGTQASATRTVGQLPPPAGGSRIQSPGPRSYFSFRSKHYPTPTLRQFRAMSRRAAGFGGVVLGNDVSSTLAKPTSLTWQADPANASQGTLSVSFSDNSTRRFGPVMTEDVFIAHKLLTADPAAGLPAPDPGEGIGLVGIEVAGKHFDCGPESLLNVGTRWQVIMHPALIDTPLGWYILMCDVLPTAPADKGLTADVTRVAGEHAAQKLTRLMDHPDLSTWKFIDVPTSIVADGANALRVRAVGYNESLCDRVFLTMRGLTTVLIEQETGDAIEGFDREAYEVMEHLISSRIEYARLNAFAQVFAITRWVSGNGASIRVDTATAPPRVTTSSSVIALESAVLPVPELPAEQLLRGQRLKLEIQADVLLSRLDASTQADIESAQQTVVAARRERTRRAEELKNSANTQLLLAFNQLNAAKSAVVAAIKQRDELLTRIKGNAGDTKTITYLGTVFTMHDQLAN